MMRGNKKKRQQSFKKFIKKQKVAAMFPQSKYSTTGKGIGA
jgi:hypothetical protein